MEERTPPQTLLRAMIDEKGALLADGGMGTGLFMRGLATGDNPELWNIEQPDRVADVHREFIEAGADIILTNSFGGNRLRLMLHGAENRVGELNAAGARLAREAAAGASRRIIVAGSIGPSGGILAPVGDLDAVDAEAAFAEQAEALAEGGVDLLWIETLSSSEELKSAAAGAARTGLPIVATMSFDTNGRTMMGLTPDAALAIARDLPVRPAAFGANCGVGPAQLLATLLGFSRLLRGDDVIVAKGNCGIPEYVDGTIRYSGPPELMARYAILARRAGARIIGGCCGTTGRHLAAMRAALDEAIAGDQAGAGRAAGAPPDIATIEEALGPITLPSETPPPRERRRRRREP